MTQQQQSTFGECLPQGHLVTKRQPSMKRDSSCHRHCPLYLTISRITNQSYSPWGCFPNFLGNTVAVHSWKFRSTVFSRRPLKKLCTIFYVILRWPRLKFESWHCLDLYLYVCYFNLLQDILQSQHEEEPQQVRVGANDIFLKCVTSTHSKVGSYFTVEWGFRNKKDRTHVECRWTLQGCYTSALREDDLTILILETHLKSQQSSYSCLFIGQ